MTSWAFDLLDKHQTKYIFCFQYSKSVHACTMSVTHGCSLLYSQIYQFTMYLDHKVLWSYTNADYGWSADSLFTTVVCAFVVNISSHKRARSKSFLNCMVSWVSCVGSRHLEHAIFYGSFLSWVSWVLLRQWLMSYTVTTKVWYTLLQLLSYMRA